jgi:hypothetical protein
VIDLASIKNQLQLGGKATHKDGALWVDDKRVCTYRSTNEWVRVVWNDGTATLRANQTISPGQTVDEWRRAFLLAAIDQRLASGGKPLPRQ